MPRSHRSTAAALAAPAVVLLALLAGLAACARPAPRTPDTASGEAAAADAEPGAADRVADALLVEKVRAKLLGKLGTDALGIEIEAAGDRVRLSGAVAERSTQELAEEVAASVRGVRRVENRIALELERDRPGAVSRAAANAERELADAALESRVKAELLAELGRHALELEVEAADGKVSLRGWLPDEARERLALEAARGTRGVDEVVDLIRVGLEE